MSDYGSEATDKAVKRVERRLSKVYSDAAKDIDQKIRDWQEGHAKRDEKYRQMVKDGKLSKQDYEAWMRGQVFQGKQWQARKKQIQEALLNADKMAMNIVTEGKLGVFATNANYIGYGLEHDSGLSTGFTLYDESTVARLIQDDPQILPMLPPEKAIKKPLAFDYYNRLMNGAITQGIIQGEDIRQIAKRIVKTTAESSYKSAVRNARTAYTGAQNAGRIEGLHQAQKLGIEVKKRWLATLDARTRDSHRELDGQVQEVDDPFKSPLGNIRFPGDPTAKPGDVYNCRCTLTYVYPKYPSTMQRRDNGTGEIVEDMTYREWEAMKQGEGEKQKQPEKFSQYTRDKNDEEYAKFANEYETLEKKVDEQYKQAYQAYNNRRRDPDGYKPILEEYEKSHRELATMREKIGPQYGIEAAAHKAQKQGIKYKALAKRGAEFDEDDIIARLGGGDMTKGSCASLGFCWAGQRAGYDVLDFRDGDSQKLFSYDCVDVLRCLKGSGVTTITGEAKSYITAGKRALKAIKDGPDGKEYYFECARHAAIVRKKGDSLEYLELQSKDRNGWRSFTERLSTEEITLNWRFGAPKTSEGRTVYAYAVDVDEMASSDRFLKLLGYINTDEGSQHKGVTGHER